MVVTKLVPSPSERAGTDFLSGGWGEAMKKKISMQKILLYVALSIAALTFIYPFIWMIGASLAPMH